MKIEVLVATMNQKDSTIYEKMNLKTDAVFANQADRYEYQCFSKQKSKVKMITTSERGVGKNRNTALMYATGDICICLLYTSPSPRDGLLSRMPSSA